MAVAGGLVGLLLLLFFLLVRGSRDTVVLQVVPLEDSSVIRVYVGGEVANPGIYSLERGSRVLDAIDEAGGVLNSADTSGIGLANQLRDADQIIVPPRRTPTDVPAPSVTDSVSSTTAPLEPSSASPTDGGLININQASATELQRLPGVGPVISERIVEHREHNGHFRRVEDLAAVNGISAAMIEEFRSLITLGQ